MSLPATQRLYYVDSRCTHFEANIVDVDQTRRRVVLDQSAFYPTSGGQPFDTGTLHNASVIDVTESGDAVVHHLDAPLPADVSSVAGRVDWSRRFDHMQQHTGQHLLSAVLEDDYGWPTVSVHFGAESCTLDISAENVSLHQLREAEQRVNERVSENLSVSVTFEESTTATGMRKASDRQGMLRIVTIEGIDRNACGGTHVTRTGEIGAVCLRRSERLRGATRIEFVCGLRAIRRARADYDIIHGLAALFSASIDDLPSLVPALQREARDAEKERARLAESLAVFEAGALYAQIEADAHGVRVHDDVVLDAPVKSRQLAAQQFTQHPKALYLMVSSAPPAVLLAASADCGFDCAKILKTALHTVGGRGGGTPNLAQGSAPSFEAALAARDHIRSLLHTGGV